MHTMRLLGKFLGYLHFSPYRVTDALPSNVMYSQLATRKYHKPPLDVAELLIESVKNNKIILTVPWVIEFLSMMDPIALTIEHYIKALQILTDIYRWEHFRAIPTESILFVRLIIGWLFDVLEYPKKYEVLIKPESFEYHKNLESCGVDFLAVVDKQLIRSCCPYLIEFRVLIYNFLNGIKNRNREIRKITPLSTKIEKTNSASVIKKQLNIQLEDNFFSYHPPSVKKTTEFVADRMASKTIGKIRSEVTELKLNVVKNIMSNKQFSSMYASNALLQIDAVIDDNVLHVYNEFQNKLHDFIKAIHKNIENTLPLLLSDDTKPVVLDICTKVAYRLAADKTADWIDSNLLLDPIKSDIKNKLFHLKKYEVESK
ncbi:Codanin-1, partial [Stegodyphus mimosarum]